MSFRSALSTFRGHREFRMNIIGHRKWWFLLSAALLALSATGLLTRDLNLGIDFRGGTVLQYENRANVTPEQIRTVMTRFGHPDAVVQLAEGNEVNIRTEALGEQRADVTEALADQAGIEPADINAEIIGPKWGQQISEKALQGLIIFLVVVSIYITMRFEWKMAVAALAAMFHDLIITAGIYVLVGREVTPETVIAVLTILGYSLYDTVVIFDKVKENATSQAMVARDTYAGTVNRSLNQVLMRSLNTSVTVVFPVGALLLFGGDTLKDFAFALMIGLLLGAYSSIFIAAPLLAIFKEREPRNRQIREKALARSERPQLQPVPAGDGERDRAEATTPTPVRRPTPVTTGVGPPRPRKPKKKPRAKRKKR